MYDLIAIGGGAAGFYGAIHAARKAPGLRVAILEQNREFLSKVRISGGGRCNVTHRPLDPSQLVSHYPRGSRELLGPFHTHASREVMAFFESLGVPLKTEADGRVFPRSDRSETVISALLAEARRLGIDLRCGEKVVGLSRQEASGNWEVATGTAAYQSRFLLVCPGSSRPVWEILGNLGHRIVSPVPSLFTFRVGDPRLEGLQGISVPARLEVIPGEPAGGPAVAINFRKAFRSGQLKAEGPLLLTHKGLSGPAVLRLSAWGARYFAASGYRFRMQVNWLPDYHPGSLPDVLSSIKQADPARTVWRCRALPMPGRLWARLAESAGIPRDQRWSELSRTGMQRLARELAQCEFEVSGKNAFKEEFVTAGGVALKEVDFRTFESRKLPGLYLAGEVLDVDAITGGFNFQSAWTGAFMAAVAIAERTGFAQESAR